ncbi:von Willebrand factor [Liparis tanakae]|uniref:von Willebrand factor n=1 Tax=Liparis tanakae TaxID=230148 RepID=A0A4Z2HKC6_9TELE|nr:von Willebrand factor [Liparis tanakae]
MAQHRSMLKIMPNTYEREGDSSACWPPTCPAVEDRSTFVMSTSSGSPRGHHNSFMMPPLSWALCVGHHVPQDSVPYAQRVVSLRRYLREILVLLHLTVCVAGTGRCSLFGRQHFHTFDGVLYEFPGDCSYLLAGDCSHRSFTLLGTLSVPFASHAVFVGSELGFYKLWSEEFGFAVTIDNAANIAVSMTKHHANRTCGLCGNFNSVTADEYTAQEGKIISIQFNSVYLYSPVSQITNVSRSALQSVHIDIPDL